MEKSEIRDSLNERALDELVELSQRLDSAKEGGKAYYGKIPRSLVKECIMSILRLLRALRKYGYRIPKYVQKEYPEYFKYQPKEESLFGNVPNKEEVPSDRYISDEEAFKLAKKRQLREIIKKYNEQLIKKWDESAKSDLIFQMIVESSGESGVLQGLPKSKFEFEKPLKMRILEQERQLAKKIKEAEAERKRKEIQRQKAEAKKVGARIPEYTDEQLSKMSLSQAIHQGILKKIREELNANAK